MLKWNANFQIPNSGVQAAVVYAFPKKQDNDVIVDFYADINKSLPIFTKEYSIPEGIINIDDYLLTLEDFSLYEKV